MPFHTAAIAHRVVGQVYTHRKKFDLAERHLKRAKRYAKRDRAVDRALMQLAERGVVDLEAPLADHVDFPLPETFELNALSRTEPWPSWPAGG